jgi:ATP-dependent protease ClpP protease subunit
VYVYLHSEGGNVFDAFSMCDHIRHNDVPVVTIADGYVASAATFVLLCGAERWALPRTTLLIHELRTNFWGQYAQLVDEMTNSEGLMKRIKALYMHNSKLDAARLDELISKELHLEASTALTLGLVDKIVAVPVDGR